MDPGEDVQLPDLQVIQRYSLAVRGATAPVGDVIAALQSDLAWLTGGGRRRAAASPTKAAPTKAAPTKAKAAPTKPTARKAGSTATRTATKATAKKKSGARRA
jgi:pyruvate/2-oxoglutarate dehydrogenase complex dihydrolipoamide acyltransferase (E2) component